MRHAEPKIAWLAVRVARPAADRRRRWASTQHAVFLLMQWHNRASGQRAAGPRAPASGGAQPVMARRCLPRWRASGGPVPLGERALTRPGGASPGLAGAVMC